MKLTISNDSSSALEVESPPFENFQDSSHLRVELPDGSCLTTHALRPGINPRGYDVTRIALQPGERLDCFIVIARGNRDRALLFSEVGRYALVFTIDGVESNQVVVQCLTAPEADRQEYERLEKLPGGGGYARSALYDGRILVLGEGKSAVGEVERLARLPGLTVYSNYAKYALAELAKYKAWICEQDGKHDEAASFMREASHKLRSISPGSALGTIGNVGSLVYVKHEEIGHDWKLKSRKPYR